MNQTNLKMRFEIGVDLGKEKAEARVGLGPAERLKAVLRAAVDRKADLAAAKAEDMATGIWNRSSQLGFYAFLQALSLFFTKMPSSYIYNYNI